MKKLILSTLIAASFSAYAGTEIPVAPSSVISGSAAKQNNADLRINSDSQINVMPGRNELVMIAMSEMNRIVTPFNKVKVVTTSAAEIKTVNNIIYVASGDQEPISMFIHEQGDDSIAYPITLFPRKIPAKEITLKAAGSGMSASVNAKQASAWENAPLTDVIVNTLREVALGNVPRGYTINPLTRHSPIPACEQPGAKFDFSKGQIMNGNKLNVVVGMVVNTSKQPIELREESCGNWDVAGVAYWPHIVLEPGEKTEVYAVMKQTTEAPKQTKRRSLIE